MGGGVVSVTGGITSIVDTTGGGMVLITGDGILFTGMKKEGLIPSYLLSSS